jgi:V8-like Glu-specific endopeptidase
MKQSSWKSLLPLGLSLLVGFDGLVPVVSAQNTPARIDIIVVEGEGVTSNIRQRVSRDPVVRIEDDDHRPLAGAAVVFALPVSGTSGEFTSGSKTLTVVTDKTGLAAAHGLKTNEIPGKLQIYVTASYRGVRARGLVNQMVEAAPGTRVPTPDTHASRSGGKWKWVVLGIVGGGAAAGAGVYYAHRNGTSNSPISISTGTVVFGSPR